MLKAFARFFAARPAITGIIWAALLAYGSLAYFSLLPREGFPSIDIPLAVANGIYLVDDAEQVDEVVAQPLAEALLDIDGVVDVQTFSNASFMTTVVNLESGLTSADGTQAIQTAADSLSLPDEVTIETVEIDAARFRGSYDLLVGITGDADATPEELETAAESTLEAFSQQPELVDAEVVQLLTTGINPVTGEEASTQTEYNSFTASKTDDGEPLSYLPSITVGVLGAEGFDALEIRDATDRALRVVEDEDLLDDSYEARVAIDFATTIRQQIGSLQSNVLTGIIAVTIVALVLISWRASVVTALFLITVLATSVGILYLLGISLNTVSLFGIILALGLFVDDAIVITESIAANQADMISQNPGEDLDDLNVIERAIGRVGTASVSGTLTTVLVFVPMLFITGILGDFIRILPISVIVSLLTSVVLSFMLIPVATRFLILPAPNSRGPLTGVEEKLSRWVADLPGAVGRQGIVRASLAVVLSIATTIVGLFVFLPDVGVNIFPPSKDTTALSTTINFAPGTSVEEAQEISDEVNQLAADALGDRMTRGFTFVGDARSSISQMDLTDLGTREPAPELVTELLDPIAESYNRAQVNFDVVSAGPPASAFPFTMQIFNEDSDVLKVAAATVAAELDGATIKRDNGTEFSVLETQIQHTESFVRVDGRRMVEVSARFDADDVTTLTTQTQGFIEDQFGADDLAELGLESDAFGFDFGNESDNQESFASLGPAFAIAFLSMLILLVVQFRSSVQWILVFLAIPFSFFGVFGGLLLTNNVLSFFVMLGFLGLIGIAVNNTILLTDFANQERRAGSDRKEAIARALQRRFRPLVATSLTTVAGLAPLALSDPFWEALGFTIIFGLLASTFLVIVSFPFYYLGFEAVRDKIRTPWRRGIDQPVKESDQPVKELVKTA